MKSSFLKSVISVIIVAAVLAVSSFLSFASPDTGSYGNDDNNIFREKETETSKGGIFRNRGNDSSDGGSLNDDPNRQLTADDIEKMNKGDVTMLFSEDGYLTFLRGKYYDEKVSDFEDGVKSLYRIQSLLGISKGSEFFGVFAEKNVMGYTFYTYQQRYGETTIQNAVLKIIVDPDGYTAGLISSFVPEIGIAPVDEASITIEEAADIVKEQYPDFDLVFFNESNRQTSITIDNVARHCFAIFTNIPFEGGMIGDRRYLEHLVSYTGKYLGYVAVTSLNEFVKGDDMQYAAAMTWFEGKEAHHYSGTITLHDGTKKDVTLPVVRDVDSGKYYLADLERNILVADYYSFEYENELVPYESDDNTGWPEHYLATYESYIRVYDFYDSFGMRSVDGFGMPILILAECCNYDRSPIDNAFFAGFDSGWAKFGASGVNYYGESIDVIAHEFTHGVTTYTFAGDLYENESGAVNEALSDIMGNICEMMLEATDDDTWLIAEKSGRTLRSMSFPWLYKQPVRVGGEFFQPMDAEPSVYNDLGGVHTNSSLVNYIAWQLCAQGMPLADAYYLWREVINLLTPLSGFREVHHALMFAAEMLGMNVVWLGRIDMFCDQAGY